MAEILDISASASGLYASSFSLGTMHYRIYTNGTISNL